jgi:hypothetical protein
MGDSPLGFAFSAANNELQGIAVLTPKPTSAVQKSRLEWFQQSSWSLVVLEPGITKRDAPRGAILLLTSIQSVV